MLVKNVLQYTGWAKKVSPYWSVWSINKSLHT